MFKNIDLWMFVVDNVPMNAKYMRIAYTRFYVDMCSVFQKKKKCIGKFNYVHNHNLHTS